MDRRDILKTVGSVGAVGTLGSGIATADGEENSDNDPRWVRWKQEQKKVAVNVDGHDLEVAYIDNNRTGTGRPPVVFLHGIPTWGFIFRDVISDIAKERRVLIPDMVGYGFSSMAEKRADLIGDENFQKVYSGFPRSIRAQELMIDNFLKKVGVGNRPVDLIGHDLGGGVFLRLAVHQPDRVNKLVLTNSVQYNSWAIEAITDLAIPANIQTVTEEQFPEILEDIYQLGTATGTQDTANPDDPWDWRHGGATLIGPDAPEEPANPEPQQFIEGNKFPLVSREQGKISFARNAHATDTNHTTEIDPAEITAETLLLWGAADVFQPVQWAQVLDADIPNSRLVPLEGAAHWAMEDKPDEYRSHLNDFILG